MYRHYPELSAMSEEQAIVMFISIHDSFQRQPWQGHHVLHVPLAETARHIPISDPEAEPEHIGRARDGEVGYQNWSSL